MVAEVKVAEVHALKELLRLGDGGALSEDPRNEFELGDIVFAVDMIIVNGVADEIEAGDAEAFFVGAIVEKWIIFSRAVA